MNGPKETACGKKTDSSHIEGEEAQTLRLPGKKRDNIFAVDDILEWRWMGKGKKEYLIRWEGCRSDQDNWEPEGNVFCEIPNNIPEEEHYRPPVALPLMIPDGVITLPGLIRNPTFYDSEWRIFYSQFLPYFNHGMRNGWKNKGLKTRSVVNYMRTWCPYAAYDVLLYGKGEVIKKGEVYHHTFNNPADVPMILVGMSERDGVYRHELWGEFTLSWWRDEYDSKDRVDFNPAVAGDVAQWRYLYCVNPGVTFHYVPTTCRIAVSFTFTFARKSKFRQWWEDPQGGPPVLTGQRLMVDDADIPTTGESSDSADE